MKLITYSLMIRGKPTTINLVMQLLKVLVEVVDFKVLVDSIVLPFPIFLRIFSVILVEVALLEGQATEEMT